MKEALYYEHLDSEKVKCTLCPKGCVISESKTGVCDVRENVQGKLYSLVYEKPVAIHIDPIEKKPLYHFIRARQFFPSELTDAIWTASSARTMI
jgi:pyruvate formate lyase activating enzyme